MTNIEIPIYLNKERFKKKKQTNKQTNKKRQKRHKITAKLDPI